MFKELAKTKAFNLFHKVERGVALSNSSHKDSIILIPQQYKSTTKKENYTTIW